MQGLTPTGGSHLCDLPFYAHLIFLIMENEDKIGHRERLRERFLSGGISALADYELLELLLTYSIPRRDVKPLAKALLRKFGSVSNVFNANKEQLIDVKGLGERSATLIKLIYACHIKHFEDKMLGSNPLSNPEDVVNFAKVFLANRRYETLLLIFVNSKNKVCGYEISSSGTVDSSLAYPRNVMVRAVERKANGLLIVHNHPSGDPTPSSEDKDVTKKMKEAARTMDVRFLDHIVVGTSGYYSFLENNMI